MLEGVEYFFRLHWKAHVEQYKRTKFHNIYFRNKNYEITRNTSYFFSENERYKNVQLFLNLSHPVCITVSDILVRGVVKLITLCV